MHRSPPVPIGSSPAFACHSGHVSAPSPAGRPAPIPGEPPARQARDPHRHDTPQSSRRPLIAFIEIGPCQISSQDVPSLERARAARPRMCLGHTRGHAAGQMRCESQVMHRITSKAGDRRPQWYAPAHPARPTGSERPVARCVRYDRSPPAPPASTHGAAQATVHNAQAPASGSVCTRHPARGRPRSAGCTTTSTPWTDSSHELYHRREPIPPHRDLHEPPTRGVPVRSGPERLRRAGSTPSAARIRVVRRWSHAPTNAAVIPHLSSYRGRQPSPASTRSARAATGCSAASGC